MIEVVVGSLMVGSFGLQTMLVSGWLGWRQLVISQKDEEEEEILTSFESKEEIATADLTIPNGSPIRSARAPRLVGWEFKIVRAKAELFRDPTIFQQLCEEEKLGGWILLEKLDDRRVRFKRPVALRDLINTEGIAYDPYRCNYGPSWTTTNWLSAIAAVLVLTVPAYLGYAYVSSVLAHSQERSRSPAPLSPPPQLTFPERPIKH